MSPCNVQFDSQGLKLAGLLWLPTGYVATKYPAIVVSPPMGGVKEQTTSLYADSMSKLGFITLAFDAAYFGESEGLPRYLEDPYHRVEDIKNAVSYLSSLTEVDKNRIGVIGICASGGYATAASQSDVPIKALATISAGNTGSVFRNGFNYSNTPEQLQNALVEAAEDRTNEACGRAPRLIQTLPSPEVAATLPDKTLLKEAYDYYATPRGQHPRSQNLLVARSIDKMVNFHPWDQADLISPRAALFIAGSIADSRYDSEEAYSKALEPKELFLVEGATHIDLYDKLEFVQPVIEKLYAYFTRYLIA